MISTENLADEVQGVFSGFWVYDRRWGFIDHGSPPEVVTGSIMSDREDRV